MGNEVASTQWYQMPAEKALEMLGASTNGLTTQEARKRLQEYGPNQLKEKEKRGAFRMFVDQFKDFMIVVLIAAAVVSGIIGDLTDTVAIAVIVLLNAIIGFVQEYRAEKAMAALKKMAATHAMAMRDGSAVDIPASLLVPGDIILLEAGSIVPADTRLVEVNSLKAEEAALTGESVPVEKNTKPLPEHDLPLGDRKNSLFKGTFVSYGRGRGVVVATGMNTELGKIASMLQEQEEVKTPLQKRLTAFSQKLAIAVLAICAIIFGIGLLRGEPALLMFLTAISLAVAAIPEALPAVVTISLALGARKMVKQNALIRKLPAVETLGSVTYICSDKTGTLTMNQMAVEELYVDGRVLRSSDCKAQNFTEPLNLLLHSMALSNDAITDKNGEVLGDPTEIALCSFAESIGLIKKDLVEQFRRIAEVPFDSDRKRMTTFHQWDDHVISFTKGAIESLIAKSDSVLTSKGVKVGGREEILRINDELAHRGLRVIAIGMKRWESLPADLSADVTESGITLLGLVGIMDPPREEVRQAVDLCKSAGIKPVMITGDHPLTAQNIAQRLNILDRDGNSVLTGAQLAKLTADQLLHLVENTRVYARVAPEQKLGIVKALQDRGQFVAMTGDGVNDAPALKRADIGVAMGITGTDVAKESADMVLLDDNFATIVKAVKEGRRLFDNLRKFIKYTMTSNSGEIWTIFLAPFLGLPIPLLPIHILWINLVTDGLPGLALAAEPAEKGIMKRPPRHPKESIFANGLGIHIIWVGLLMGGTSLFTQALSIKTGLFHWQSMVFTVLCLSQMGHVMAIRSEKESLFHQGLLSNKPLLGAFLLTFVSQMLVLYVPFLHPIFKTESLTFYELLLTLALSSVVFMAVEIEKFWKRSRAGKRKGFTDSDN
jgi:Ca2+-transporting ATPase